MGPSIQLKIWLQSCGKRAVKLACGVLTLALTNGYVAAQNAAPALDEPRGVIDQLVSIGFEPINVFLLKEAGLGEVRKYPAAFVSAAKSSGSGARPEGYLVGSELPLSVLTKGAAEAFFSFFLVGQEGMFAATPVRSWTRVRMVENAKSDDVLKIETEDMRHEQALARAEVEQIETELRTLRDRASRMAGIDEIIELKTELSRLKSIGEENSADRAQLRHLLEISQLREEGPEMTQRLLDLSQDLKAAALITADAERLSRRRQSAAAATVQDKLALVKETSGRNAEELAQEVLRLRTRRKDLERQLRVSSDKPEDF